MTIRVISEVLGPCSFPHGPCFTITTQLFTFCAILMSLLTLTSCQFVRSAEVLPDGQATDADIVYVGHGLVSRQNTSPSVPGTCLGYTSDERQELWDGPWKVALTLAVLACCLGILIFVALSFTCCVALELAVFSKLFWVTMLCFLFQTLVFLLWASNTLCDLEEEERDCAWGRGSGLNITASLLWLWAANMIKSMPEYLPTSSSKPNTTTRRRQMYEEDSDHVDNDREPRQQRPSSSREKPRGAKSTRKQTNNTQSPSSRQSGRSGAASKGSPKTRRKKANAPNSSNSSTKNGREKRRKQRSAPN